MLVEVILRLFETLGLRHCELNDLIGRVIGVNLVGHVLLRKKARRWEQLYVEHLKRIETGDGKTRGLIGQNLFLIRHIGIPHFFSTFKLHSPVRSWAISTLAICVTS